MAKYFTYSEFTNSDTAKKLGIDNTPKEEYIQDNIIELMRVMDVIRERWTEHCEENLLYKQQVIITSGYRCEDLNKAVNGSKTSAHKIGSACDFIPANGFISDLFRVVQEVLYNEGIPFDQLLLETSGMTQWIHLGLKNNNGEKRGQVKCLNI